MRRRQDRPGRHTRTCLAGRWLDRLRARRGRRGGASRPAVALIVTLPPTLPPDGMSAAELTRIDGLPPIRIGPYLNHGESDEPD